MHIVNIKCHDLDGDLLETVTSPKFNNEKFTDADNPLDFLKQRSFKNKSRPVFRKTTARRHFYLEKNNRS